jgi:hypothetical protein
MATADARKFTPHHRFDRSFFAAFVLVSWTGVIFGFFPASSARMVGKADYVAPLILHVHAMLFVAWLLLLTLQVLLVRFRQTKVHRKLGILGVLLIPLMAYSGIAAELYSQRFYIRRNEDGLDFFILPLFYIAAFAAFASAALLFTRRDPAAHKRLVLLATTVIVGAAYARWWGPSLTRLVGDDYWGMIANTFAGTNLIIAAALLYDTLTRGRPHRIYAIGVPILLLGQLLCSWIYHASWWPPISRVLIQTNLPLSS